MFADYIEVVFPVHIAVCLLISQATGEMCKIEKYFGYKPSRTGEVARGVKITHDCIRGHKFNGDEERKDNAIEATCMGNNKWDKFDNDKHKCKWSPRISKLASTGWNSKKNGEKLTIVCRAHFMDGQEDFSAGPNSVSLYETDSDFKNIRLIHDVKLSTDDRTVIISKETTYTEGNNYRCVAEQHLKGGNGFKLRRNMLGVRHGTVMIPEKKVRPKVPEEKVRPKVYPTPPVDKKGSYLTPQAMRLDGINGKTLKYGSTVPISCSALIGFVKAEEATRMVLVAFAKEEAKSSRKLRLPTKLSYDPTTGRLTANADLLVMSKFTANDKLSCKMTVPDAVKGFTSNTVTSNNFELSAQIQGTFVVDANKEAEHYADNQQMDASIENAGTKAKMTEPAMLTLILAAATLSN